MTKKVFFVLNRGGVKDSLLFGDKIKKLEQTALENELALIKAEFLTQFGFEGGFEIRYEPTSQRSNYRLQATDARTGAVLKNHPGWLAKFSQGAKL